MRASTMMNLPWQSKVFPNQSKYINPSLELAKDLFTKLLSKTIDLISMTRVTHSRKFSKLRTHMRPKEPNTSQVLPSSNKHQTQFMDPEEELELPNSRTWLLNNNSSTCKETWRPPTSRTSTTPLMWPPTPSRKLRKARAFPSKKINSKISDDTDERSLRT